MKSISKVLFVCLLSGIGSAIIHAQELSFLNKIPFENESMVECINDYPRGCGGLELSDDGPCLGQCDMQVCISYQDIVSGGFTKEDEAIALGLGLYIYLIHSDEFMGMSINVSGKGYAIYLKPHTIYAAIMSREPYRKDETFKGLFEVTDYAMLFKVLSLCGFTGLEEMQTVFGGPERSRDYFYFPHFN